MAITSVAHVCIKTCDLDATADFYCGALGLKRLFDFTRKGQVIGFYMRAGNTTFIETFLDGDLVPANQHKSVLSHFCLETDDIAALHASMTLRGLRPGPLIVGCDGTQQFWMNDPNGLAIEFQEYTEKSSQLSGRSVEVNW